MKSELALLDHIYGVRRFPPGRLFTVLLAMRLLAAEAALRALIARIDLGLEAARRYVNVRRLRQHRRLGRGGGRAKKVDKVIDDDLAEIAHIAGKEAERYPDTPSGRAAQALIDAFFSGGVAPITQIPYDEELAVVENMMPLMRAEHAEAIDLLGIERLVARIEGHLPLYREALSPDETVSAAELAEAYEAMQVGLLRVLGHVTVMVEDAGLRRRLLAPMLAHDAQLAALNAAARRGGAAGAEDVVPDSPDLDAEVRAALDEAARAAAEAEAEAEAAADARMDLPPG